MVENREIIITTPQNKGLVEPFSLHMYFKSSVLLLSSGPHSCSQMHVSVVTVLKHKDFLIWRYPQGSTDLLLPLVLPIRGTKGQTSSYVSNAPQPECKFIVLAELLTSVSNTFNKLGFIGLGPLSTSSQS